MAKGNDIIVAANPRGVFLEGIISGTDKPGTVMQILAATEPIGGRFTWTVYDPAADGDQLLIAVLNIDKLQGKNETDAYVTAGRCFLYCPAMGEELNMRRADIAGTADDVAIGDLFIIDKGTGHLIATTGSPESEPFQALETVTDPTAETLLHCIFTGY